jgi:flagellar hook assembly protein FlgD
LRVIVNGNVVASISPNPMNPEATLTFQTSREGPVHAALYDLRGRKVRTLLDAGGLAAGYHDVRIDGRNDSGGRLASGIYFVAIESPDGNLRSKVTILR